MIQRNLKIFCNHTTEAHESSPSQQSYLSFFQNSLYGVLQPHIDTVTINMYFAEEGKIMLNKIKVTTPGE